MQKIPYRRVRAWPNARASKGILHTRQQGIREVIMFYVFTCQITIHY